MKTGSGEKPGLEADVGEVGSLRERTEERQTEAATLGNTPSFRDP